jgi:electron transfer flavoprotein beta subunit
LRIVVLVKEVPDTYGDRKLDPATGLADRGVSERVMDEIGERAVEAALAIKDVDVETEVIAVSMGPQTVTTMLRKALAMGCDSAVHVLDDALPGADLSLTAEVLAAAVRKVGFDVVLTGNASTDGAAGLIAPMLAEWLGTTHATFLSSWRLGDGIVEGERDTDGGQATIRAALPAVVSITEAFPEGRLPKFKGIMAAKKKPFETWSLADLGVSAEPDVPRAILVSVAEKPPRGAGERVTDDGHAGDRLATFLLENRLA